MKGRETLRIEQLLYDLTNQVGTYKCHEVGLFHGKEIVDFMSVSTRRVISCYEIKTSLSDYKSKASLSFHGHRNFYVLSGSLYKTLEDKNLLKNIPKHIGIYAVESDRLVLKKRCSIVKPEFSVEKALFALIKSILREKGKLENGLF